MLFDLSAINFSCFDVNIWFMFRRINPLELKSLLYNLCKQSASLYFISFSGVALCDILCKDSNDARLSIFFQHTLKPLPMHLIMYVSDLNSD